MEGDCEDRGWIGVGVKIGVMGIEMEWRQTYRFVGADNFQIAQDILLVQKGEKNRIERNRNIFN